MAKIYCSIATFLQTMIILAGIVFYIFAHPYTLESVLSKVLKDSDIKIGHLEGSLLYGVKMYDFKYRNLLYAKSVNIKYDIQSLFSLTPKIESVNISSLRVFSTNFKKSEKKRKRVEFNTPPIKISKLILNNAMIKQKVPVDFNLTASNIIFHNSSFFVDRFNSKISTPYAKADISGSYKDSLLDSRGRLYPAEKYLDKLQKSSFDLPKSYAIKIRADKKSANLTTFIKDEIFYKDNNITISNLYINAKFLYKKKLLTADMKYLLNTPIAQANVEQKASLDKSGLLLTQLNGKVLNSHYSLPFETFKIRAKLKNSSFNLDSKAGPFILTASSNDYKDIKIDLISKPHKLSYIKKAPKVVTDEAVSLKVNGELKLKERLAFKGEIDIDSKSSKVIGSVEADKNAFLLKSDILYKKRAGFWKKIPDNFHSNYKLYLYIEENRKIFNLFCEENSITIFEKSGNIFGWSRVGTLSSDISGRLLKGGGVNLIFKNQIDSIATFLKEFDILDSKEFDAEVKTLLTVDIKEKVRAKYLVEIPWYIYKADSQTVYYGLDSYFKGQVEERKVILNEYRLNLDDRVFFQDSHSIFKIEKDKLKIVQFFILDNLALKGIYNFKKLEGKFTLEGKNSRYKGVEADIKSDVNLTVKLAKSSLAIEGEVFILDGTIKYKPKKSFEINDKDIVIIQDIKPPSSTKVFLNIHIQSKKPLKYQVSDIDIDFIPDITIWKEYNKPFGILGYIKLSKGALVASGKKFFISDSYIYFIGENPIDPYLDIHLLYTLDINKFNIFITQNLSRPIFLFSSEPPMSQNDIMSYILFGTSSDEAFGGSSDPSGAIATLLLGSTLKDVIGSATGVKLDIINIIASNDGKFGIEIGKRIGKRLRVLYRNDTVSSFIIRYKASRSIRIDIDVKDTGQGINILYIRDIGKFGFKF